MDNKRRVVVLLSGGMDSTVLLHHHIIVEGDPVTAIGFNYGQRHHKELTYAMEMAKLTNTPFIAVGMQSLKHVLAGSSQTSDSIEVPEGKYDEASMKATVVPNRNMIMLSIAIGHAISVGANAVSYAAHGGDHAIYPDCREDFAQAMEVAAGLCDWRHIGLLRPFVNKTKTNLVTLGLGLGVDFAKTWSCYKGADLHCGRCGTCIERREAFYLAGQPDPTVYGPLSLPVGEMVKNDWHLPDA